MKEQSLINTNLTGETFGDLKRKNDELGERIKELNCIYLITDLIIKSLDFETILEDVLELIIAGWQYPEITCVRIIFENKVYKSANFQDTPWKQSGSMCLYGKNVGCVEVFYLEEKEDADEGPFLREERNLLNAITKKLEEAALRFKAEKARIESERRHRSLFEDTSFPIWEEDLSALRNYFDIIRHSGVTDFDDYFKTHPETLHHCSSLIKVLAFNKKCMEFFQITDSNEFTWKLPDFFREESWPAFKNELVALANGHTQFESEITLYKPTGQRMHIIFHVAVCSGYEETLGRVILSFIDITHRKLMENEIKLNEMRLDSLLKISQVQDASKQDIFDHALQEAIVLTGSKIGFIYYYSEDTQQFTLHAWSKEVMDDCKILEPQTIYQLEKTGLWGETVRQRKAIMVNDYNAPNPYKKGVPEGHVPLEKFLSIPIIFKDRIEAIIGVGNKKEDYDQSDVRQLYLLMNSIMNIIEQKNAQEQLKKAKIEAEAANQAKSRFLAMMSHEIRTPLNGITGLITILMADSHSEKLANYFQMLKHSADSLADIINDVLDLSKIEAGRLELSNSPFDLYKTLVAIERMYAIKAREKHLEIHCHVSPDVPELVIGDELRLKQILHNLVGNALKFTENGCITMDIRKGTGDQIDFSITDTGIGIPEKELNNIFDRFYQVDSRVSRQFQGTGLGLPITKELIHLMGGELHVSSTSGRGSCFSFSIPLETQIKMCPVEPLIKERVENPTNATNLMESEQKKLNILAAEDDMINQLIIRSYIEDKDWTIQIANNGIEVIDMLEKEPFDLILMDVEMPGKDGLTATREIRANPKFSHIPILATTAHALKEEYEKCLESGMNGCITKPIDQKVLYEMIEKWRPVNP